MNIINLSKDAAFALALAASVNGTTTLTSSIIDTAGYDSVCFITNVISGAANNIAKIQSGALANGSDQADVASSHVAATLSPSQLFLDCVRPPGRYVTFVLTRGTTTVVGEVYAILYNSKEAPINNVAGNFLGVYLNSPLNGTA